MKGQLTGMRGVYLVAAELSRLGFIASPTSRSALAADILVTDQACQRAFSVQVKTNSEAPNFWHVGKHTVVSPTHVYVLVNLNSKKDAVKPEFFVVPSSVLKERTVYSKHPKSEFWAVYKNDNPNKGIKGVLAYKDKWDVFGDPHAEIRLEEAPEGQEAEAESAS
jgi:hypothetical protein